MNQIPFSLEDAVFAVGEVAADLIHPEAVWRSCDSSELNSPGRELDEEEDHEALQSLHGPDFDGEEVCCGDLVEVAGNEFFPGRFLFPVRGGFDAVAFENVGDGFG